MSERTFNERNELNLQSSKANFLINTTLAYIRIAILMVLRTNVMPVTTIKTLAFGD